MGDRGSKVHKIADAVGLFNQDFMYQLEHEKAVFWENLRRRLGIG